jgi:hypothetical protein
MLDALKSLTGGSKAAQKQADEFQTLIAAAKEERGALNTMLTQITMRSSRLSQIGKSLPCSAAARISTPCGSRSRTSTSPTRT